MKSENLGLGQKTNLMFSKRMGDVIDRGDYLVIKNPDNPNYHWGNYLLFENAPDINSYDRWVELFKREFPYLNESNHRLFTWIEQKEGEVNAFLNQGYVVDAGKILTANQLIEPKKRNNEIDIRKISSDSDWDQVVKLQIKCEDPKYVNDNFNQFKAIQMGQYRSMSDAGLGFWFGAFLESKLVADLGVFFENGIARFQSVETDPEFRNRGICKTLVYETGTMALDLFDNKILVMDADPDYHVAHIYESLGFQPTEMNYSLSWWKR